MKVTKLDAVHISDLAELIPEAEEDKPALQYCSDFLTGKLKEGWRVYQGKTDEGKVAQAIVYEPEAGVFKIFAEDTIVIHCIFTPEVTEYEDLCGKLLHYIEEDVEDDYRAIAAVVYTNGSLNPYRFFKLNGYEYAAQDTLASVVIKRLDPEAKPLTFVPSLPKIYILENRIRVQINYDPSCPSTYRAYKKISEYVREQVANEKVFVEEYVIDSDEKYEVYGFPGVFINRMSMPSGPITVEQFDEELEKFLDNEIPQSPAG